mgnify:CR=1 FL=1
MKKLLAFLLCFVMIFTLAACGGEKPQGGEENGLTLALVVAGNFGDRSFYDSSNEGATRLEAEGVTVKRIECGNEKHTEQIYNAADAADIVVLVGWEFYDVAAVAPDGGYKNRMYFVEPDGKVTYYDKRHLFSYSGEDKCYESGKERVIVEFRSVRFFLQVC